MKYSILKLFVLTAFVTCSGCSDDNSNTHTKTTSDQERSAELASTMQFIQEQELLYRRKVMELMLKCEGHLSSNMTEDFCVPEDWRPFEFNNETYYVQPLSVSWD